MRGTVVKVAIVAAASVVHGNQFIHANNRYMDGPGLHGNLNSFGPGDRLSRTRMSMGILNITECTTIIPHLHTNFDEVEYVISGSGIAGTILPNGTAINYRFKAGDLMVFPLGQMHYQYASDPGNDTLIAVLGNNQNINLLPGTAMGLMPPSAFPSQSGDFYPISSGQPAGPVQPTPIDLIARTMGMTVADAEKYIGGSSGVYGYHNPHYTLSDARAKSTSGGRLPVQLCTDAKNAGTIPDYAEFNLVDGYALGYIFDLDGSTGFQQGPWADSLTATQKVAVADFLSFDANRRLDGPGFLDSMGGSSAMQCSFLEGLQLSHSVTEIPASCGHMPMHMHTNADELAFVVEGSGNAGHVAINGTTMYYSIKKGDVIIIPQGLPHFFMNDPQSSTPMKLLSSYNNQHFTQANVGNTVENLPYAFTRQWFSPNGGNNLTQQEDNELATALNGKSLKGKAERLQSATAPTNSCPPAGYLDKYVVDGYAMGYVSNIADYVAGTVNGEVHKQAAFVTM
eukprot:CFRG2158T1